MKPKQEKTNRITTKCKAQERHTYKEGLTHDKRGSSNREKELINQSALFRQPTIPTLKTKTEISKNIWKIKGLNMKRKALQLSKENMKEFSLYLLSNT